MRVRVLPPAARDLIEIQTYLRQETPQTADRTIDTLLTRIERLERFPKLGPIPRDEGLQNRGFRVARAERYLVFYKIKRTTVLVHRVLHERREHGSFL